MDLTALQANIYLKLQETSSYSAFSTTFVTAALNEAYYKWAAATDWDWLRDLSKKTGIYTTLASDYGGGSTIVVSSYSNMFGSQTLYISDGTVFEYTETSGTPSTTTVTINNTDFPLTTSFVSGNYVYSNQISLPTDFDSELFIVAENIASGVQSEVTLKQASWEDVVHYTPLITDTGDPEYYWIENGNMFVYPLPDKVWKYYIRYNKKITALSSGTDSPLMPVKDHYDLISGALAILLASEVRSDPNMIQHAGMYQQKFDMALNKAVSEHNSRRMRYASFSLSDDDDLPSWR